MAECLIDIMPEIDFVVNSSGITIYCPNRIRMPRFVPFDLRGRCSQCRGDQIDIDYIIQEDGVTIYSTRLKQEKFVPFDWPVPFPENSNKMIRIKQGSKHFTIPIKRSQTRSNTVVIPTALLKSNDGQAKPVNKEVENIKLNELPQIQEESGLVFLKVNKKDYFLGAEEKPKMRNILKDTIDIVQTAVSAINEKYSEV